MDEKKVPKSAQESYFNKPVRIDIISPYIPHFTPEQYDVYTNRYSKIAKRESSYTPKR